MKETFRFDKHLLFSCTIFYSNKEVAILVMRKRTHLQHKSLLCNTAVEKRIVEKQTKTKKHCLFPCPGHAYSNALLKGRPSYDTHLGCYYICPKQPFLGHYFSCPSFPVLHSILFSFKLLLCARYWHGSITSVHVLSRFCVQGMCR